MAVTREEVFKEALKLVIRATHRHEISSIKAIELIAALIDKMENGEDIPLPAEAYFPYWFTGASWHEYFEKPREVDTVRHVAEQSFHGMQPIDMSYVDTDEQELAVDERYQRIRAAMFERAEHPRQRQKLSDWVSFMKGRELIYVEDKRDRTHHVPECHWDDYMSFRKSLPVDVIIYSTRRELVSTLAEEGVVV